LLGQFSVVSSKAPHQSFQRTTLSRKFNFRFCWLHESNTLSLLSLSLFLVLVMAQQLTEELSNFERYLRYRRPVDFQFRPSDKTFVWVPDGKGAFYTAEGITF
jgi:hypothetical protein